MRSSSDTVKYVLDVDAAIKAIRAYNGSPCAQAGEHLLDVAFSDLHAALGPDGVHKQVVLLDSLWGTRLYMERGASDRIAGSLAAQSESIVHALESLADDDLLERPDHVAAVSQQVLPVILDQTGNGGEVYACVTSLSSM